MASPLSILVKTVVTVGLISGVGRVMYLNSITKADIAATQQNIQILKQETTKKQHRKLKKKVTVSQYQRATKEGNVVVGVMNQILSDPKVSQQGLDYKSQPVKVLDKYDSYGGHRLALTMPFVLTGYHVQFAHSGSDSDNNIVCSFMFYNPQNQLQAFLKAKYDPESEKFFGYHLVSTKAANDAKNAAMERLSAQANDKANQQQTKEGAGH